MAAVISPNVRASTLPELLRTRAEQTPDAIATYHRDAEGRWAPTTWSGVWEAVQRTASAFRALGFTRGSRLAILARTCREWQIAEMGAILAGGAVLGIDVHAAPEQIATILETAGVRGLVVDNDASLARIPQGVRSRLAFLVAIDTALSDHSSDVLTWDAIATHPIASMDDSTGSPADAVMVIYTSGTTGASKAIEYTHEQVLIACRSMLDEFPDFAGSRLVSWLPMAALFQRMLNLLAIAGQSVTYFVEDPRQIIANLKEIRPTVFTSVPRFYEKVYEGIQEQIAAQQGLPRRLARAALEAGAAWSRCQRSGTAPGLALRIRHAVLDRLVLQRIRAVMGGEIKWMISGSAAAPVWLLDFYHSIGLLVLEAYGITENPVPIAANHPNEFRFGSVGRPFAANQVRLADDGEVLVKGPALFESYIGESRPRDRMTADGFYRTGDFGRFDVDGFLYLTGRVAELIKTTTGRRISPAAIEGVYRQSRYVDQIVVVGNDRPHLVALVVANQAAIDTAMQGSTSDGRSAHAAKGLIDEDLKRLGSQLSRHERIRAFALLPEPLAVERGELTPTLKFRRDRIEARYLAMIGEMYQEREQITS